MFVGCAPAILRPSGLLSALRPQDVFATSLYTGTGASQTITNGLDLLGQGGLVWGKARSVANSHVLVDTKRGASNSLFSNGTAAEGSFPTVTGFTASGFTLGNDASLNGSGNTNAAWSFRRASKFFDVVTYTGDGTSGRVIPHALGIDPGLVTTKARSSTSSWPVYHRSLGANKVLYLNATDAVATQSNQINTADATTFTVSGSANAAGVTYVAYLFAHDPDTTNGIVQCGSYTENGASQDLTFGWQPQIFLVKSAATISDWFIFDAARGFTSTSSLSLSPNTSAAERSFSSPAPFIPKATGLTISGGFFNNGTAVFLAIRTPI